MRNIDSMTGSHWCTAQKWLTRIPMSRTTTSPSASAVVRPGTGFANMVTPLPYGIAALSPWTVLDSGASQGGATISPAYRSLVVAVAAFRRLGYEWGAELLMSYGTLMHETAKLDLDFVETHPSEAERVETAVLGAVLTEPMLQALRRLAQEEETTRRYGFG